MRKINVYLDTQDYSRFGRVIEGKGSDNDKKIYEDLLELKKNGRVSFVYSMPILGELLQFDDAYASTSLAKAEAVEVLCDSNAMLYISDLIAFEISQIALKKGLISTAPLCSSAISDNNGWFPRLPDLLLEGKAEITHHIQSLMQEGNRETRRSLKKEGKSKIYARAAENAASAMHAKYGLPQTTIKRVLVDYWTGKITGEEASEGLFHSIARPRNFCQIYFGPHNDNKDLPHWVSDLGRTIQSALIEIHQTATQQVQTKEQKAEAIAYLEASSPLSAHKLLSLETGDMAHFGMSKAIYEAFQRTPSLASEISTPQVLNAILLEYILRTSGLRAQTLETERGFGGDLVHAIYLPHVDLWRTDRRFSDVVAHALPEFKNKIVPKMADLPNAITDAIENAC